MNISTKLRLDSITLQASGAILNAAFLIGDIQHYAAQIPVTLEEANRFNPGETYDLQLISESEARQPKQAPSPDYESMKMEATPVTEMKVAGVPSATVAGQGTVQPAPHSIAQPAPVRHG